MKLILSFLCLAVVTGLTTQTMAAQATVTAPYEETYGEWNWSAQPNSPCANGLCPLQQGN